MNTLNVHAIVTNYVFAGNLPVIRKSDGKEHVEMGFPAIHCFDVKKLDGRWLVVAFSE